MTIDSGTLLLGAPGAAGTGEIDFGASAPSFLQVSIAAAPTNTIGGFTFGDTIDVTDLAVTSPTILALGPGNVLDIPYDSGADTLALTFTSADDVGGFSIASDGSGGGDISFVLNTPPTLSGTSPSVITTDESTINPFPTLSVTDPEMGAMEAVTITLSSAANGTLSGAGLTAEGNGVYALSAGSPLAVSKDLEALVFTPSAHQVTPGGTVTTGVTLSVSNDGGPAVISTSSIKAVAVNDTPSISGAGVTKAATDEAGIKPLTGVTVSDPDTGATENVTILLASGATATDANGTLTGTGLTKIGVGTYTLNGSTAAVTAELDALTFTPTAHQVAPGQSVGTNIIIVDDQNGAYFGVSDSVIATAVNDLPTLSGTSPSLATTDETTIKAFPTLMVTDPDFGATEAVTISLSNAANGSLSGAGLTAKGNGVYTLAAASAGFISSELDGLIFTPTAHQVAPGSTVTTGITLTVSNDGGPAVTSASSISVTAVNDTPSITGVKTGQTTTDEASLKPLAGVTIADPDTGVTETVTILLASGVTPTDANGTLSGNGLTKTGVGSYTLTGSAAEVTAELDALTFTPTAHEAAPGQSVDTNIIVVDYQGSASAGAYTSIFATAVNDAPKITGTQAGLATTSYVPIKPFSTAVISDPDTGVTDQLTITLLNSAGAATDANGTLSGTGVTKTGTGVYVLAGTPAAMTTQLQALIFTPTAAEAAAGKVVTTQFALTATQTAGGVTTSATDKTTSVATTELNYITGPTSGFAVLLGTSGPDVITANSSYNTVYGNGGNDYINATSGGHNDFVLPAAGSGVETITGFSETNGDILNLAAPLQAAGWNVLAPLGNYLKVTDAGNNTTLSIAANGIGAGVTLAVLNDSPNLGLADLLKNNSLIV